MSFLSSCPYLDWEFSKDAAQQSYWTFIVTWVLGSPFPLKLLIHEERAVAFTVIMLFTVVALNWSHFIYWKSILYMHEFTYVIRYNFRNPGLDPSLFFFPKLLLFKFTLSDSWFRQTNSKRDTYEAIGEVWAEYLMVWNYCFRGFPGGAVVKNPPANAGDMGSSPSRERSHMPWSN